MELVPRRRSSMWASVWLVLVLHVATLVSGYIGIPRRGMDAASGLCASIISFNGYPCEEFTVQTSDGYLLSIQHVAYGASGAGSGNQPPVYLQHGLFGGGDNFVLNSPEESLAFMLADQGYDVWIGNARCNYWSHGHISLSPQDAEYWDWTFDQHASIDLPALVSYVYKETGTPMYYVAHSQGTIMALAALSQSPQLASMLKAAALMSPIAYMKHITSTLVRVGADLMLDSLFTFFGIEEISLDSNNEAWSKLMSLACARPGVNCGDMMTAITGQNCCYNSSRAAFYDEWGPQPSSTKNLQHLAQMIRSGTFAMFDYGQNGNAVHYNQDTPPTYQLASIPQAFPILLAYGGNDALADPGDVGILMTSLQCKVDTLYLDNYAHSDFVTSMRANVDVYTPIIAYFQAHT